jgi:hypothetical protein
MIVIDGAIGAAFLNMRIEHPRMTKAHRIYDGLRQMKILAPHKPQRCACLFAPTQSGKSKTVESYIETRIVDEALNAKLFPLDMDAARLLDNSAWHFMLHWTARLTPSHLRQRS